MSGIEPVRDTSEALLGPGTTVIESRKGWRDLGIREMAEYRDLFWFLVYRGIRSRYAQSALGIGWAVIQPLATTLVFTVIFGKMVKVASDGAPYALFSLVAMAPWTYFQNAITEGTQTLTTEKAMISKIYFPRLILPISRVLARLVDFGVVMLIVAGMMLAYRQPPTMGVVYLPVLVLVLMATAAGTSMLLSAMSVQYRDVGYAMNFVVRLLMYAAPVVYPTSLVPERFRLLYALNPMVGVIEGFRSALLGTMPMPWDLILPGSVVSLVLLVVGAAYFRRKERVFADVA